MQHDFILLDRSGSMAEGGLWVEALSSINVYVKKLADDGVDTGVTLATFDLDRDGMSFDIIRDRITPKTWRPVSNKDATPRGGTPLNDAIGKIVARAKEGHNGQQYDKLALIIMTDGYENSSREFTFETAKRLLDDCRGKGWQVIFLGANFENSRQATSYGTRATQFVASSAQNLGQTMTATAAMRTGYATGQSATMDFTDLQKAQAGQGLGGQGLGGQGGALKGNAQTPSASNNQSKP